MKNDAQPSLFSFVSTLKLVKEEFPAHHQPKQERSPYLKAVLSGTSRSSQSEKNNTDREAALRYIRESKMLKRI